MKLIKPILTILSLLLLTAANAQTPVTPSPKGGWIKANSSYGTIQDRISAGKVFLFPTACGTPAELYGTDLGQAAIFFDSCGNTLYKYSPSLHAWSPIEGGGGGSTLPYNGDTSYFLAGDSLLHQFVELIVHDTCCGTSHISNDTLFIVGGSSSTVLQDGLVTPGYVTWSGTGLTYDVTSATYIVNGITYVSDPGSITLDVADPDNPRIDVIAVDTSGNIVALTGDPAPNPAEPQVDPESQVLLTSISVPAGALVPIGVTQDIIYDENTENFTGTTSGITLNLDNTTTPYHLTKSANVGSWTTTRNINFTQNTATSTASDYTMLKMYIWLKQPITGGIRVSFLNGETLVSNILTVSPGVGYNKNLDSSYQNISIPMSSFVFTNNTFNKIRITVTGTGSGFYLDYLQLQGGIYPPADENPYPIFYGKNATGDSTVLKMSNGVNYLAKDSIGVGTDTTSLSNRINLKVNISDTAAMLTPYLRKVDTASMLSTYLRTNIAAATYRTQAQVRTDISLTTTGSSGAATYNNATGVLNVPQYSGGTTTNALTFNNSGSGDASGTTFDGSAARTLSYNSIGAVPTTRTVNGTALSSNVTLTLASSQFANQGTTTTVLHGNASGNPSWAQIAIADLSATGTPSSSTYLRGDNTWATITGLGANLTAQRMVYSSGTGAISTSSNYQVDTAKGYFGINGTPTTALHVFQPSTLQGTVAITSGSATVTGTGTFFKTDFLGGGSITINGETRIISFITSNTSLTTTTNFASSVSGVSYTNASTNLSSGVFKVENNGNVSSYGTNFITAGSSNVGLGSGVLASNTSGSRNVGVGTSALVSNTTGGQNTGIGYVALSANNTGGDNAAFGYTSMSANTTGSRNSSFGSRTYTTGTTASDNSGFGYSTLGTNTSGAGNTAGGSSAMSSNTTGSSNSGFGVNALGGNTTGGNNVGNGSAALFSNATGSSSTAIGTNSLLTQGTGIASFTVTNGGTGYTTATVGLSPNPGVATATAVLSGGVITAINIVDPGYGFKTAPTVSITGDGTGGAATAVLNTTGQNNTAIGYQSGYNARQSSGSVFIGYDSRGKVNTSNKLYIDNQNDTSLSLLYGDFSAGTLTVNGTLITTKPVATTGSTPSIAAGTGAGTSPTVSVTGNDAAGYVTIATGTSPTASGNIVTITFSTAITNTPKSILLTAANDNAATEVAKFYVDQSTASTSSWVIKNTSSALTASTTYKIYYSITQ